MKPVVRRLGPSGDAEVFLVRWMGLEQMVVVSGAWMRISKKSALALLPEAIQIQFRKVML